MLARDRRWTCVASNARRATDQRYDRAPAALVRAQSSRPDAKSMELELVNEHVDAAHGIVVGEVLLEVGWKEQRFAARGTEDVRQGKTF